ncbi:ankyrin repeat domain-containing protein [Uliginosibacterium paludis]|uniref:Ankyrin repeat domain-containing protein n=1 Tax=Uliginosibacterium paludis TaxID=1615952 RepID=A0ABV2CUB8_9RHOO
MAMNERVVELLNRIKSSPDFSYVVFDSINATNALGDNALHSVCVWGDLESAQLLVSNGINIHQEGELGFTPLRVAVDFGHFKIAEYLKANGADPASIYAPERFDRERNDLHLKKLGEEIEALEKHIEGECP